MRELQDLVEEARDVGAMGAFFTSPTVRRILANRSFSFTPGTDDEVLHARVGWAQAVRL